MYKRQIKTRTTEGSTTYEQRIMVMGGRTFKDTRVSAGMPTGTKTTMGTEGVPVPTEVEVEATRVTDEATMKMTITSQNPDQQ